MTREEYDAAWAERTAKFVVVRNALNNSQHRYAYRMAYKQPWKFYNEHTADEAIKILIEQFAD